jgi:hypothetical protein
LACACALGTRDSKTELTLKTAPHRFYRKPEKPIGTKFNFRNLGKENQKPSGFLVYQLVFGRFFIQNSNFE